AETGDRRDGSQLADALLGASSRDQMPTAWICFNGVMARGVVSHLSSQGIDVPGDVSITAFDATRVCEEEHPTLTAASTSPELMGRVAAERLLQVKDEKHDSFVDSVLPARMTLRESSGEAPKATSVRRKRSRRSSSGSRKSKIEPAG
ncbi:MAG TPA: substrate-binding domain-containing protein, partial [Opitutales bacterium]|nr:substrate-binding domain-containing protein [Opitutales bacterium]